MLVSGGLYLFAPAAQGEDLFNDGVISMGYDGSLADGASTEPDVSGDGRYVAFTSEATNLVPGDTNGVADVFVFDRVTRKTLRVSVTSDGEQANGASRHPSISADGRYVAFESDATNLGPPPAGLMFADRAKLEAAYGSRHPGVPAVSADQRGLVIERITAIPTRVYLRDVRTGTTTEVSVSSSGEVANLEAHGPWISADGRYVAYTSMATNLVPGDENLGEFGGGIDWWTSVGPLAPLGGTDGFLYDVAARSTSRISVSALGAELFGDSAVQGISDDGSRVLFISDAANVTLGQARPVRELPNDPSTLPGESPATQVPLPLPYVRDSRRDSTVPVGVPPDIVQYEQPRLTGDGLGVLMQTTTVPGGALSGLETFKLYLFRIGNSSVETLQSPAPAQPPGCSGDVSRDGSEIALCTWGLGSTGLVLRDVVRGSGVTLFGYSRAITRDYTRWTDPSISADASVVAFLVGGPSVTSGSQTSDVYLVAR